MRLKALSSELLTLIVYKTTQLYDKNRNNKYCATVNDIETGTSTATRHKFHNSAVFLIHRTQMKNTIMEQYFHEGT